MANIEKTVFISYRRTDFPWALAVYQYLTAKGYDVFFDVTSISVGAFEQIIIGNIKARAHFLVILTPSALERCNEPADWLRREIETAIHEKRNIIPLFFNGFSFSTPSITKNLTGTLAKIKEYSGLEVPIAFFEEAMDRLSNRYLNVALETILHPVSDNVQKVVIEQQDAANKISQEAEDLYAEALRTELLGELEKALTHYYKVRKIDSLYPGIDRKINDLEEELRNKREERVELDKAAKKKISRKPVLSYGLSGLVIVVLIALVFGGIYFFRKKFIPEESAPTQPVQSEELGIGSTMISKKDDMTMVYVPAGEFEMGNENGNVDEKPVHPVYLDAFWIDQTEITNAMYLKCVNAGNCSLPQQGRSKLQDVYFVNPNFANYPVIYVSWDDANRYCKWAGRRLPTEAEWEKAASWDQEQRRKSSYSCGESIDCTMANYYGKPGGGSCVGDTTAVSSYKNCQSPYGVYDMVGNVWEWVADLYDGQYYAYSPYSNPKGPNTDSTRIIRGGGWDWNSGASSSTFRRDVIPTTAIDDLGFRCALSASD